MIVQNNATPWIFLALVIMGGCALTGMLLGNAGPFDKEIASAKIHITETQAAMNVQATQSERVAIAQQTEVVVQLTARPYQQTATHFAVVSTVEAAQAVATQTALANNSHNEQLLIQATRTAIANEMSAVAHHRAREQSLTIVAIVIIGVGLIAFVGWIIVRAFVQAAIARAQVMSSQAQLLAEQRRLAALRASIKEKKEVQGSRYPIPKTLLTKKPGDSDGLPKAE